MWRNCYKMVKLCLFVSWSNEGTMLSTHNQSEVDLRDWCMEDSRNYSFCKKNFNSALTLLKNPSVINSPPSEEIQGITNPKNKFLKAKQQRSIAVFDTTIHGFTISVQVLLLPIFRQFLLRNGKISSKSLFWNERTQRADNRWQQQLFHKHFNQL